MSAVEVRSRNVSTPASVLRSRVIPFLFRFIALKFDCRFQGRSPGSPFGYAPDLFGGFTGPLAILCTDSTLRSSAPMSANKVPQKGPAQISESSIALTPSRGKPGMELTFSLLTRSPFLSKTQCLQRKAGDDPLRLGSSVALPLVRALVSCRGQLLA